MSLFKMDLTELMRSLKQTVEDGQYEDAARIALALSNLPAMSAGRALVYATQAAALAQLARGEA